MSKKKHKHNSRPELQNDRVEMEEKVVRELVEEEEQSVEEKGKQADVDALLEEMERQVSETPVSEAAAESSEEVSAEGRRGLLKVALSRVKDVLKAIWHEKDAIRDVIKNKHRFVVMDSQTFKEKFSFQLTGINLFVVLGVSMILLVLLTTVIIAFTPLREFIPGYTNTRLTEQSYQNAVVIDSLEQVVMGQERMMADIKAIMMGEDPATLHRGDVQNDTAGTAPGKYTHSKEDTLLRKEVESADKYSVRVKEKKDAKSGDMATLAATPVSMQLFFTPMKGKVVTGFDPKTKHYGVNISGTINEVVKSVMSGTVLMSSFTAETGYVMAIQHQGGYISVYKNNSALLKHDGDAVWAGEPIAYLGDVGDATTGPHLHFELWLSGKPVNPLQYISF